MILLSSLLYCLWIELLQTKNANAPANGEGTEEPSSSHSSEDLLRKENAELKKKLSELESNNKNLEHQFEKQRKELQAIIEENFQHFQQQIVRQIKQVRNRCVWTKISWFRLYGEHLLSYFEIVRKKLVLNPSLSVLLPIIIGRYIQTDKRSNPVGSGYSAAAILSQTLKHSNESNDNNNNNAG